MDTKRFFAEYAGLDAILRSAGLAYGPDVWQAVYTLLDRLEQQNRLPKQDEDWVRLLGPLFCRCPQDQARFPYLFKEWRQGKPELAAANTVGSQSQQAVVTLIKQFKRSLRWWLLGSLLIISMLLAGYWYLNRTDTGDRVNVPPPEPKVCVDCPSPVVDIKLSILDRVELRYLPEPLPQRWQSWLLQIERLLNWLPIIVALGWLVKRYLPRWILHTQAVNGDELLNKFYFEHLLPLFGGAEADAALRDLRATCFLPTTRINVLASAEATARAGNYFQPVYQQRRVTPEHLLLVRSQHRRDHQTALADELLNRCREAGMVVVAYYFRDDPHWLVRWDEDEQAEYRELPQLLARYAEARLVVISETDILYHPYSGEIRPWLQQLNKWQQRIWLHPRNATVWQQKCLAEQQFILLPFTPDSLPELITRLSSAQANRFETPTALPWTLPSLIAAEPDAWLGEKPPYGASVPALLVELENYLGSSAMRLLRAIAVFPKPHWDLSRALDYLLFAEQGGNNPAAQERRLARLSRLPWLTHAHLPNWLRQALLRGMPRQERRAITQAWRRLFNSVTQSASPTGLKLDVRVPSKRQIKTGLNLLQAMQNSSNVNDPIFANILLGGKLGLLDFQLPQLLAKLLPGSSKWLALQPLLLAVLLTVSSVWGLQTLWNDVGKQQLVEFWQQGVKQENAAWRVEITYQPETQQLAKFVQSALQAAQFKTAAPVSLTLASDAKTSITYAVGGLAIAQRVANSLAWYSYGMPVALTEAPALVANTLQVQLAKTYQANAVFKDTLSVPYKAAQNLNTASYNNSLLEPEMVEIKAGSFIMGSPDTEADRSADESPQHTVMFTRPYEIGKYKVTFAEYDQFAQATGRTMPDDSKWGREKRPVIHVSFDDAQAYVAWLSQQTGKNYHLPTEAEWEYAARASTNSAYYWGNGSIDDYEWYSKNSGRQTHPVGEKKPNAFGLYDTSGNVYEWTQDCWHENYQQAPEDGSVWLASDAGDCGRRVVRGGSWGLNPLDLRSALRFRFDTDAAFIGLGFRVARAL